MRGSGDRAPERAIRTAEIVAVGSELTTGDTRDTNGGELARELSDLGVDVRRLTALPDDLALVTATLVDAISRADLVVTTGGLGPTPDDLTREAIAAAIGETPAVDAALEQELRRLFERRGVAMPERNRKQAWLIPSASALANPNGTAPGWWVERRDGGIVVALPGPPRELRPMWRDEVLPRLGARDVGGDHAVAVLRLAGIGESHVAELIGDELLGDANPSVATYARADSVDVRVAARADGSRTAGEILAATLESVEAVLARHVFARNGETWLDAVGGRTRGRTLALSEHGTGGTLTALLGGARWLVEARSLAHAVADVRTAAVRIRDAAGADIGLAITVAERDADTAVHVAIASATGVTARTRLAFLNGEEGRRRAAVLACVELWRWLGGDGTE